MWATYVVVLVAVLATAVIYRLRNMPDDRWAIAAVVLGVMLPCLTTLVVFVANRSWYTTWPVAAVLLLLSLAGLGLMIADLRREGAPGRSGERTRG